MSDMLNQMNRYTVKYHYNQLMNRLNILTDIQHKLILETYANIPAENMYAILIFKNTSLKAKDKPQFIRKI